MGLSDALARRAVRCAHLLVVEVPGHWRTRMAVERHAGDRGWVLATSPADADIVAVCGTPGPQLAAAVELVWQQLPGPRVRVGVPAPEAVTDRLDQAADELRDTARHREDARTRPPTGMDQGGMEGMDGMAGMDHGGMAGMDGMDHGGGMEGMDHGGMAGMDHGGMAGMEGMDHGGMDGMDGMDHGGMEMAPDGIPLAGSGEDRDGLEMDVLHVRLGPVLPHWPAGLVLRCSLQGDVVVEADVQVLDGAATDPIAEASGPARLCDSIAALLALAGWDDAAAEARAVRDHVLAAGADRGAGADQSATAARLSALRRKVARSRLLRWSLRGVRPVSESDDGDLPSVLRGDIYDRLIAMLDRAQAALTEESSAVAAAADHGVPVGLLPRLVEGLDLAATRLVVASLGPDLRHTQRAVQHA